MNSVINRQMRKEISKNKNVEDFISLVKCELKKQNGKLVLISSVKNKSFEDGEFSEIDMVIKCFVDLSSNYWIGVLAHEYCHFVQCSKNLKIWNNFQEKMALLKNQENIFKGKSLIRKQKRKKIADAIIRLELDCDKRAVEIIKKYSLPVDTKEYISKANIILYKYLFWSEYGIWPNLKDKKTGNTIDWKIFKMFKFLPLTKYLSIQNMPKKIFYLFLDN
jgi:hypothetical protein